MNKPQIIRMAIATYEGSESWKTLKPMILSPDQEKRIGVIWNEAQLAIKKIVYEEPRIES